MKSAIINFSIITLFNIAGGRYRTSPVSFITTLTNHVPSNLSSALYIQKSKIDKIKASDFWVIPDRGYLFNENINRVILHSTLNRK